MGKNLIKKIQVWGSNRKKILKKFHQIIKKWGLKMPDVEPLVSDFGLGNFFKTGLIEYWISNEEKEGYCGKYLFVFNNQTCPEHYHKKKHETFFVVKGKVKMKINGKSLIKNEGNRVVMPQGTKHSFTGIGNALLLEVSTPCIVEDNYFSDTHIKNIFSNG